MGDSLRIKKKLTPDLLKVVNRVLDLYPGLYLIEDKNPYDLYIADKDPLSDFFFGVVKESSDKNGHYVEYTRKPYSSTAKTGGATTQNISNFENNLKEWFNNLQIYNEPSPIDDLILKGYQDEFYDDFKIVDDDADQTGFSYPQQLKLLEYLNGITEQLEDLKDEQNSDLVNEIKTDTSTLASELTKETKNGTMKRLSKIWAKGRKAGLKVSGFMLKEFAKEFLKEGAKALFNYTTKNAHKIPEYINHLMSNPNLLN